MKEHDIVLVEDDPYGELRFGGERPSCKNVSEVFCKGSNKREQRILAELKM